MKRLLSTIFGLAVLCVFAQAHAVPSTVSFTGRLSTSAGPVNGAVSMTFTLYTAATAGSSVWTENRTGLTATNGLVFVDLGAATTLDESVFDGAPLFLEIIVGTETLSPRVPIRSVPYAIRATAADSADTLGTINPGDVVTTVNASGGVSAVRAGNTVSLTGTPVTGVAPVAATAGAVSLTTCAVNQIYKMVGGVWQCSADVDTNTTYSAVAQGGVLVNASNQIGLLSTCTATQVLKAGAIAGTWACGSDADSGGDITDVIPGTGLTGGAASGAATLSVNTATIQARVTGTCPTGQAISAVAVGGGVTCQIDTGFSSCTWEQGTTTTATTTQDAACPAGKHAVSGGCDPAGTATVSFTRPFGPPAAGASAAAVNSWNCQFSAAAIGHRAFALCCNIN